MTNQWSIKPEPDVDGDGLPSETAAGQSDAHSDDIESSQMREMYDELAVMRAEIESVRDSVQSLAEGATRLVRIAPSLVNEELDAFVQRKPIAALLGTTLLSYAFTRHLLR